MVKKFINNEKKIRKNKPYKKSILFIKFLSFLNKIFLNTKEKPKITSKMR